jgi:diguanylate cyclase (GGDEF)-like protein
MVLRALTGPSTRRGRLEIWIAISAVAILIATVAVVFYALRSLASEVNHIDEELTRKSTAAALSAFERRLTDTHRDYAKWDDAVANLYNTPDPGFVRENFADGSATGILFDTAFLIDETGRDLVAFVNGKPIEATSPDYFGPALRRLIPDSHPGGEYSAGTGLLKTPDGIVVASAGRIVPFSTRIAIPPGQERILVLAKHIDDGAIAKLGKEFVIDGLRFAAGEQTPGQDVRLADPTGSTIASVTWTQRTPGTAAFAQISPAVYLMLLLLSAIVIGLVVVGWINIRAALRSKAVAEHAAHHDYLTGLPNRTGLVMALGPQNFEARSLNELAVAFFDLDGFKEVNDAYGHKVGDQLLRACAGGFGFIAEGRGVLARVGGDEFAFVASGPEARAVANEVGKQFIAFLRGSLGIEGVEVRIGTSVGIATGRYGLVSVEELLRRADIAMYEAKKEGGNHIAYYDAEIDQRLHDRVDLTACLRQAIADDQFDMSYQVIVDSASHEPRAVEALIRWTMPNGRQIAPDDFIPLAEESGLIEELGARVLWRACRDALAWQNVQIAVNVSPIQFRNPGFDALVGQILADTGLPAKRLELEFTERHLLTEFDRAVETMMRLRSRGILLSLDDFGTGYSSIGYLRRFRFDRLKIDQSISAGITTDTSVQHLVQGTIAIARSMDLTVTAEGVENEYQAQLLRLAGCSRLQGHFFGQPIPAERMSFELNRREGQQWRTEARHAMAG